MFRAAEQLKHNIATCHIKWVVHLMLKVDFFSAIQRPWSGVKGEALGKRGVKPMFFLNPGPAGPGYALPLQTV